MPCDKQSGKGLDPPVCSEPNHALEAVVCLSPLLRGVFPSQPRRLQAALCRVVLGLVLLLGLPSCSRVKGSGVPGEVEREVAGFRAVTARGPVEVELYVDPLSAEETILLEISGDDNLVSLLETDVANERLTAGPPEGVRFVPRQPLVVRATVPDLSAATTFEDARVVGAGVAGETLTVDAFGNSRVILAGEATQAVISAQDSTVVDALDLYAESAGVHAAGGAQVLVCATSSLVVQAEGASRVTYACEPASVSLDLGDEAACVPGG